MNNIHAHLLLNHNISRKLEVRRLLVFVQISSFHMDHIHFKHIQLKMRRVLVSCQNPGPTAILPPNSQQFTGPTPNAARTLRENDFL